MLCFVWVGLCVLLWIVVMKVGLLLCGDVKVKFVLFVFGLICEDVFDV